LVQRGAIAPNLLFQKLNPDIEPYYNGLQVPTQLLPWPELPDGAPRRVSVNSFGECEYMDNTRISPMISPPLTPAPFQEIV
jgi:hybrid polyketide synthase/nonribosomal peptide synthetase ACE1